jgi:MSHA biogenesis protein MshN
MSLINKMLQDLDARGTPPGESFPSNIKPVAPERRGPSPAVIGAALAAACAVLALAWFGWSRLHTPQPTNSPAAAVAQPAPAPIKAAGMSSTITVTPVNSAPSAMPAGAQARPAPVVSPAQEAPAAPSPRQVQRTPSQPREQAPAARLAAKQAAKQAYVVPAKSVAPAEPDSEEAREARRAMMAELEARQARKAAASAAKARPAAAGRQENTAQRAEGEYRRALASLQEGRMIETIAALELALRIDPGHEAARQTLVGLLIEQKRPDEAVRQLQLGLTQDPRQPALAMLLARLQIERGGSGLETLMRTLPYVGGNPDYHAFLAGALQRQQRHREAAAEYQAALRGMPANGVWWMGLGISLQAEKRNAEALDAFQRAKGSGTLSQELLAFVERRLQQLAH